MGFLIYLDRREWMKKNAIFITNMEKTRRWFAPRFFIPP